jgi:hypothetical protein
MTPNTVRIVAAVVDTKQALLYKEDGTTITIKQGDNRLAGIICTITPVLAAGGVAEVSLMRDYNQYKDYEEKSGGLVKFFRVAKQALSNLLSGPKEIGTTAPLPLSVGVPPKTATSITVAAPYLPIHVVGEKEARMVSAVSEIMARGTSASDHNFDDEDLGEGSSDTLVAVVDNRVIGGVEALKHQITRANLGSTKGMDAFFKRAAAVAAERYHSVEDLLKFMQRGDLPVADDGSIVIYKVLRRSGEGYVDCHTKKVTQKIGSVVCMDANMVDPDRGQDCSNGLHVARRGYIRNFSGDACVIAKVSPEDVIAVPLYDANKMRVCAYHILFELPDEAYQKLRADRPFTDTEEGRLLLGRALSGDHVGKLELVRITEGYGGGIKITSLVEGAPAVTAEVTVPLSVAAEALSASDDPKTMAPAIDPKAISQQVNEAKSHRVEVNAQGAVVVVKTQAERAQDLYREFENAKTNVSQENAARKLIDFKKSAKKGWSALGLSDNEAQRVMSAVS